MTDQDGLLHPQSLQQTFSIPGTCLQDDTNLLRTKSYKLLDAYNQAKSVTAGKFAIASLLQTGDYTTQEQMAARQVLLKAGGLLFAVVFRLKGCCTASYRFNEDNEEQAEARESLASEVYGLPSGPSGQVIGLSLSPYGGLSKAITLHPSLPPCWDRGWITSRL